MLATRKKMRTMEVFDEKMKKLTVELAEQMKEANKLDEAIKKSLEGIGYGL